jgi:hypothetical protein
MTRALMERYEIGHLRRGRGNGHGSTATPVALVGFAKFIYSETLTAPRLLSFY